MQKGQNNKMIGYILLLIYVIAGSLGMVLIKKGGMASNLSATKSAFSMSFSWIFLLGMFAYLISFLLWIYILQLFSITYISPVSYGLVFIATAIFSNLLLGINITKEQIIGACFVIIGIVIASLGNK